MKKARILTKKIQRNLLSSLRLQLKPKKYLRKMNNWVKIVERILKNLTWKMMRSVRKSLKVRIVWST